MMLDEYAIYSNGAKDVVGDLNPLAIFSLVRKVPSAQTCMTVRRESDGAMLDIDFLAGMPKNRQYNLLQGSDGKLGLIGMEGIASTVTVDQGIFTITGDNSSEYVNMQWNPLIFNSEGRRVYIRGRTRLVSGNLPEHIYVHIDTMTGGRTTYELPAPTNPFEWNEFSFIIKMGTSYTIAGGEVDGSSFDNYKVDRALIEVHYGTQENATGAVWQIDGRVTEELQNGPICIDIGADDINPLYNMTEAEINAYLPDYVKPFGFDSGEVDMATLINFCVDTTGLVKEWKDQTGYSFTAVQTASDNMPIIFQDNTAFPFIVLYPAEHHYWTANGAILQDQSIFTVTTKHMAVVRDTVTRYLYSQGTQSYIAIVDGDTLEFKGDGTVNEMDAHANDEIGTAMQRAESSVKMFVNGSLVSTQSVAPSTITDTSNTRVGRDAAGTGYWEGTIFEICFYGAAPPAKYANALSADKLVNDSALVNKVPLASDKVPGCIMGWGLTKLRSDAEHCLYVKRMSDGEETYIGFDGKWMDIPYLSSFAGYDSVGVLKAIDQMGNGFDLLANDVNDPPLIVQNGTLKPGVMLEPGQWLATAKTNCRARYIRDYCGGATGAGSQAIWTELAAYTYNDTVKPGSITNIAYGKPVTCNQAITYGTLSGLTNQNLTYASGYESSYVATEQIDRIIPYMTVDLGDEYDLTNIVVWHRWDNGMTWPSTKTQISLDGEVWVDVFDSAESGTYQESMTGHIIYESTLHDLNDFTLYTSFTADYVNIEDWARVAGKGGPLQGTSFPNNGWGISRYNVTTTGDFRIDSQSHNNQIARLPNVWDTGHAMCYCWNNAENKLFAYKDWQRMTSMGAAGGPSASNGVVTFPIGTETINNAFPFVIGGIKEDFVGAYKCNLLFDHIISDQEIADLKTCAL